jgi:hypothetical protein
MCFAIIIDKNIFWKEIAVSIVKKEEDDNQN